MEKLRIEEKKLQTENGEINLRYMLLSGNNEYKIFAETEYDAEIASCGSEANQANKLLDSFVENGVTPTTLSDIAHDCQIT